MRWKKQKRNEMKTTIDRALLEQALELLEMLEDYVARIDGNDSQHGSTNNALRNALAQPVQPVQSVPALNVWVVVDKHGAAQTWSTPSFVGPERETQLEAYNRGFPDSAPSSSVLLAAVP